MYKLLNEKWLESLPEPVVENLQQQNAEVIKIICDRIKYFGNLRPTEIKKLTNSVAFAGADLKKIEKLIMRYAKLNRAEVQKIFQSAAAESDTFAEQFYKYRGLQPVQTGADSYLQGFLSALGETTAASFQNLSNTYGFKFPNRQAATLRQTYSSIIDRAIYEIKTGVTDYNTALRQSVRQLADSGIRVVDWASGVTRRADTAARMNILDGVRQLSQQMLHYHAQQYGSNGVELSAHAISAPDHVEAQGHQFTNAEFEKMQSGADFEDVNGKSYAGFKRPIGQWNCKHLAFPIIIGVSQPAHSESELNRLKQNSAEKYVLTQEMRRKETNLRKLKERRMAYSAAGNDLDAMRTQREINEETRCYKAFCKENSLAPQNNRTDVDGFRKISVVDKPKNNGIINIQSDVMNKEFENQRYGRNKDTIVNKTYIESGEYKKKFNSIDENAKVQKSLYDKSKEMLKHRSGTTLEDMYWIDSESGNVVAQEINGQKERLVDYSANTRKTVDSYHNKTLIAIHSHPSSMPPSISDFNSCFQNQYKCGYIACHNGKVFAYTSNEEVSEKLYSMYVEKFIKNGLSEYEAQISTIYKLMNNYKIDFWEVK